MSYNSYGSFDEASRAGFKNVANLVDYHMKDSAKGLSSAEREKLRSQNIALFHRVCDVLQLQYLNALPAEDEFAVGGVSIKTKDCAHLRANNEVMFTEAVIPAVLDLIKVDQSERASRNVQHYTIPQLHHGAIGPLQVMTRANNFRTFSERNSAAIGIAQPAIARAFHSRKMGKPITVQGVRLPEGSLCYVDREANRPVLCYSAEVLESVEKIARKIMKERQLAKKKADGGIHDGATSRC